MIFGRNMEVLRRRWLPWMTLLLAAAVVVTSFFYVRRLRSDIALGDAELAMPGGGPAHTSYLPLSLRGNPRELWNIRLE